MPKHILVVRHSVSSDLCLFEDILNEKGFTITKVEGFSTRIDKINPLDYDAVIVLGGAIGVYQMDKFPYLKDEMKLIKKCIKADHPLLSICLGTQLAAAACGESVHKGSSGWERGFLDIELLPAAKDTPLKHFDAKKTKIFQWHQDTFGLPEKAVLLASSDKYKNQAYRIGENFFALQFHPEMDALKLYSIIVERNTADWIDELRTDIKKYLPKLQKQTRLFMDDLLKHWGIA